MSCAGKLTKI